eukprot:1157834-Pelagomonas_calceolata.AAC.11
MCLPCICCGLALSQQCKGPLFAYCWFLDVADFPCDLTEVRAAERRPENFALRPENIVVHDAAVAVQAGAQGAHALYWYMGVF